MKDRGILGYAAKRFSMTLPLQTVGVARLCIIVGVAKRGMIK